jgi:peptidoglycan hydrolase-like protein with peptidoglycan-binding domain
MSVSQMESLLATLETELRALEVQAGIAPSAYVFVRDLTLQSRGPDVQALQQYLNTHGFPVITTPSYAGSLGHETQYFGNATQKALSLFQGSVGITPASGYFGPITRAYLKNAGF